jgi:hypothetical protein
MLDAIHIYLLLEILAGILFRGLLGDFDPELTHRKSQ